MRGNFQIIVLAVFVALAIFGILVFSGAIPLGTSDEPGSLGTVVLWGTVPSSAMSPLLETFNNDNPSFILRYVQKSADTFDQDLLEALAEGTGPDLVFLPDELVFHYANKIFAIPYDTYPLASFKSNFASAGEVFLTSNGMLAFPITIDPLVLYYNRSTLDANAVVYPPAFWDEVSALVPTLTKKDDSNKIIKSTVALGHFSNVVHAKDIISALFMQAGNPIVVEKNGTLISALSTSGLASGLGSVLKFYTDFADPNNSAYSWNKSFPNSRDAFSRGDLAFYIGYASELPSLVNKNPNQNFSAASFPQNRNANFKLTGAHVMGISLLASSKNFTTAFTAASLLATGDFAGKLAQSLGVAPARRDLLAQKPADAYSPTFYNSALYARSWLDPSSKGTDDIFRRMVDGVLSNSISPDSAITDANSKLNFLLLK